jgi:hypothetical protein
MIEIEMNIIGGLTFGIIGIIFLVIATIVLLKLKTASNKGKINASFCILLIIGLFLLSFGSCMTGKEIFLRGHKKGYGQGEIDFTGKPTQSLKIGKEYRVIYVVHSSYFGTLILNGPDEPAEWYPEEDERLFMFLDGPDSWDYILYERNLEDEIPVELSIGDTITMLEGNRLVVIEDN